MSCKKHSLPWQGSGWPIFLQIAMIAFGGFHPSPVAAQSGPAVWVAPALERITQTAPAGASGAAAIYAAKGESESFQIVVKAPSTGLALSNVQVSDLTGPLGAIIPKSAFTLYREHYVYVSQTSPDWGGSNRPLGPGWYPDALIPFTNPDTGAPLSGATLTAVPFSVSAGQNVPIWVDILVPRTATAGQYTGTYTVSTAQGSVTGNISLAVWNFTLPSKPSLKTSFGFWKTINRGDQAEMLKSRVHSLRSTTADQRYLIDNWGLRTAGLPFWSGADMSTCTMSPAPSVATIQNSIAAQQPDMQHFVYSADEVGGCTNLYTQLQEWARNIHQAGSKQLVTMPPTPALYDDGSGTGRSAIDYWVVLPKQYDQTVSQVQTVLTKGDEVWSYNALVQDSYSPKWTIDFAPVNFRVMPGFLNQQMKLTGLLYWRADLWSSDPWNQVNNIGYFAPNANYPGDGMFVYPGAQVGITSVAPSTRLKWIRDGADDYDYFEILKSLGRETWALQTAATVGTTWTNWTRNPSVIESVRRQLGDEIERVASGALSAPVLTSPANGITGVATSTTLSWQASSGATSYDVYFGPSSNPPYAGNTASITFSATGLTGGTTYYWRAVARNGSSLSPSSATWSFSTQTALQAPAAPVLSSPANGATLSSTGTTLVWLAATGAASYDVYLGTTANPALVSSTTGLSYAANSLNAGVLYYWRIVARNATGSTSSLTFAFQTPAALVSNTVMSANPAAASGSTQTFQFTYSNPAGLAGLSGFNALLNTSDSGANACWLYYDRAANTVALADDSTAVWTPVSLGSSSSVQNSQCGIPGAAAAATSSSTSLTLTIRIDFKSAFNGTKNMYMRSVSASSSSNYASVGTFNVAVSSNAVPVPVSATPSTGQGLTQRFTFVWSDADGAQQMTANALFAASANIVNACAIYFDPATKTISLASNTGTTWTSVNITKNSWRSMQNGQCKLTSGSYQLAGNNLSLTVSITFSGSFAGQKSIFMKAQDSAGGQSSYTAMGSWRVQ